ncbi:hypothetical protein RBSH_02505 [Rhodopirellula baltica SH28]|uniref:Uncharacterized protein n=1 Tax=Rhodopirellula baltica SH28 TaxID=993517 RepID=K5CEG5_RHOBT|nr:hypothetical protein RBSH_02505 [Rhodopirellula baltica SH28]
MKHVQKRLAKTVSNEGDPRATTESTHLGSRFGSWQSQAHRVAGFAKNSDTHHFVLFASFVV